MVTKNVRKRKSGRPRKTWMQQMTETKEEKHIRSQDFGIRKQEIDIMAEIRSTEPFDTLKDK